MPTYKLFYFNARGAGELSRLLFKVAGVEFTDERVDRAKWPEIKSTMPLQAMPVLEVDGKKFCQSLAIARYLAKTFKLMGSSPEEEFLIEELMETNSEIMNKVFSKIFPENDEEKKKELIKEFINEGFTVYKNFFVRRLKENSSGSGYYVGKKLTLADVGIFSMFDLLRRWWSKYGLDIIESSPELQQHFKKVESVPAIAKWIKERPETPF